MSILIPNNVAKTNLPIKPILKPVLKTKIIPIRHAIYQEKSEEIAKEKKTLTTKKIKKVTAKSSPNSNSIVEATEIKNNGFAATDETNETKSNVAENHIVKVDSFNSNSWVPSEITSFRTGKDKIVASFDVGIKHLAYCVMRISTDSDKEELQSNTNTNSHQITLKKYEIFDWGIINLIDDNDDCICCYNMPKTNKCCGKKASFTSDDKHLCVVHARKYTDAKPIPPSPKADSIPIQTLCLNMVRKLDEYPIFLQVDDVLIEQQPAFGSSRPFFGKFKGSNTGTATTATAGPGVHPRMKNLSYMIYSYFIMRGMSDKQFQSTERQIKSVKFISSTNKLKLYDGPEIILTQKNAYARNKAMAKEHLRYTLRSQPDLLTFFDTYKKKDDLADCFLQGAWYLKKGINSTTDVI